MIEVPLKSKKPEAAAPKAAAQEVVVPEYRGTSLIRNRHVQ